MITYTINQGQLNKIQKKLDPDLFQKGIDIALMRVGLEIRTKASQDAPFKTGDLRRSLISKQDQTSVTVGTDLIYARIQEFGGTIKPKKGKYLTFQIDGQWVKTGSVTIPKRPYLTPAFEEQKKGRAVDILSEEFAKLLNI